MNAIVFFNLIWTGHDFVLSGINASVGECYIDNTDVSTLISY